MRKIIANLKDQEILAILIVLIIFLICVFSFRAYNHIHQFEDHRHFEPHDNQVIQPWMTVHYISYQLNVSEQTIYNQLNINKTLADEKLTLAAICKKKHLNCTLAIQDLNSLNSP